MSVLTDASGNGYHLTVPTPADWTFTANLPNGENAMSGDANVTTCYNTSGSAFYTSTGSWSIEFWLRFTASAVYRTIVSVSQTGSGGVPGIAWQVYLANTETLSFVHYNTSNLQFFERHSAVLTGGVWYYVVLTHTGTAAPLLYINDQLHTGGSAAGNSGTAYAPASPRLYVGADGGNGNDWTADFFVSKLAIYDRVLTIAERDRHYLRMKAT